GLRPSALLYQVSRPATATMMIMPSPLSRNCIHTAPEISTMAKWAAKDRNTPRQKISNECCPHTIGGQSQRDLSPGQSRGRKRTRTHGQREKMREAKNVEIDLVDGVNELSQPVRDILAHAGQIPGQRDDEGEQQIGDRDAQGDPRLQHRREPLRAAQRAPRA